MKIMYGYDPGIWQAKIHSNMGISEYSEYHEQSDISPANLETSRIIE